jgi:hypothetical protein
MKTYFNNEINDDWLIDFVKWHKNKESNKESIKEFNLWYLNKKKNEFKIKLWNLSKKGYKDTNGKTLIDNLNYIDFFFTSDDFFTCKNYIINVTINTYDKTYILYKIPKE